MGGEQEDNGSDHEDDHDGTSNENILEDLWSVKCKTTDFFKITTRAVSAPTDAASFPPCTIVAGSAAIHLNIKPKLCCKSIDEVAHQFDLLDLHAALDDYVNREGKPYPLNCFHTFSTRWSSSSSDGNLPFTELQVRSKACVQQKSYYYPEETPSMFTIHAHPPDRDWKHGRYDAGIVQVDELYQWLMSGLQGMLPSPLFGA